MKGAYISQTYLDGILALREVHVLLALLLGDERSLVLGESSTDGTGVLGSEVEREVLLVLVEEAELDALVGLDDGQDTGDRLANIVAVCPKICRLAFCSRTRILKIKIPRLVAQKIRRMALRRVARNAVRSSCLFLIISFCASLEWPLPSIRRCRHRMWY